MNTTESSFWKVITSLGELPGILVPLSIIALISVQGLYTQRNLQQRQQSGIQLFNQELIRVLLVAFGGVFCSYSIGTVIKYLYYKPRPIPRDTSTLWKRINAGSMPSIHSSNGLITAVSLYISFISMINLDRHITIHQRGGPIILIGCFLYYLSIALSRIALEKHYPIDVFAGTILGIIITLGILVTSDQLISIIEQMMISFI